MKLHRRYFLTLSAASAGSVFFSHWALGQNQNSQNSVHKSVNGLLELPLEAREGTAQLGNQEAYLLNYNGQVPGPRLEVKPGDTIRIHFTNKLNKPTNLHFHGLHIPPTGKADNMFLMIDPNQSFTYEFTLSQNHPAGTFWYHPHHHGNSAEQVFGGLAGVLVVRGNLDEIPEVKAAQEEFLVLKDFELDANRRLVNNFNPMAMMIGREGSLLTINGQLNPTFSIPTGGLLRWRLVNASASRFYRLALEDHNFYLIATDGGAIAAPVEVAEVLLAPGERAEVLIKGVRPPGQYRLLNLPYDRGCMNMNMGGMMHHGSGMGGMGRMGGMPQNICSQSYSDQTLATLTYQGSTDSLPLPSQLIPVSALPEPSKTRRFEFSMAMGMGTGMGMAFLFNGKSYAPDRIDTEVQLGTIEEWELVNVDPDRMDHPFHLHINPFQVISRNGQPEPYLAWKDTVLVKGGETVRIRIAFQDFTGKTMYHCHILDHEDLGMMGNLMIQA